MLRATLRHLAQTSPVPAPPAVNQTASGVARGAANRSTAQRSRGSADVSPPVSMPASPAGTSPRPRSPTSAAQQQMTVPAPKSPAPKRRNRILMMCTALGEKDTPQWPFWKWQHIKATRGVTDFAMLAVTREESFIATIQDGVASTRSLRRGLKTVQPKLLRQFLDEFYAENSYFVYGGHGVSDLLEFDKDHRMQVHELADCFGSRRFLGVLFDACLMSSLDTAYYLRKNTDFIGASEGYMWEEDTWAENHMFNAYSAALMARDSDGERVLKLIGEEYTSKSSMADFTLIDTEHAEALWDRVHDVHIADIHASVELKPEVKSGEVPVNVDLEAEFDVDLLPKRVGVNGRTHVHPPDFPPGVTDKGFVVPRSWAYRANYSMPNSLYPEEEGDDHIVDLLSCVKHDPVTRDLLDKVVAWRSGPSNMELYSVEEMGGLNLSISQYSYQSMRRAMPRAQAAELAAKYAEAAQGGAGRSTESVPVSPLVTTQSPEELVNATIKAHATPIPLSPAERVAAVVPSALPAAPTPAPSVARPVSGAVPTSAARASPAASSARSSPASSARRSPGGA